MTERLLQYIWQFKYYNASSLVTVEGDLVKVLHPGNFNSHQGPDFSAARIIIGSTTWAGNVELHTRSSDWKRHRHSIDEHYDNVILHVIWHHDMIEQLPFPTLVLEDRVPKLLLSRYDELMKQAGFIPCDKNISSIGSLQWQSWKERLLAERLTQKTELVFQYLAQNLNSWEECLWWMIARNFGALQNSDAFESIARSLPLKILVQNKQQLLRLEALLLGQAGLLEKDFEEAYPNLLKKEYRFLRHKHALPPAHAQLLFLRMRPANFPTLRLAQLAMLLHTSAQLFTKVIETADVKDIKAMLDLTANDYWHYHYMLDEPSVFRLKRLGKQMADNIIINTIAPILFAYGKFHANESIKTKALQWLEAVAAEKNSIVNGYTGLGVRVVNAFDSQAILQLKHAYCDQRKCLDCVVGATILKAGS